MWFLFATQFSVLAKFCHQDFGFQQKVAWELFGHNLKTLVKFQDPQNVLATQEQEDCATVSSTQFCDLPSKWANE